VALIGFDMHDSIASHAQTHAIVFEVGDGQADEVAAILERHGFRDVRITNDLGGTPRVVEGRK
jgi:methylase of polypeptide subunit release factors